MIYYSSFSPNFPYEQCKELYKINEYLVQPNGLEFDKLIEGLKGNFWAVCDNDNNLMGCIYFEIRDNNWYLSGFSK